MKLLICALLVGLSISPGYSDTVEIAYPIERSAIKSNINGEIIDIQPGESITVPVETRTVYLPSEIEWMTRPEPVREREQGEATLVGVVIFVVTTMVVMVCVGGSK